MRPSQKKRQRRLKHGYVPLGMVMATPPPAGSEFQSKRKEFCQVHLQQAHTRLGRVNRQILHTLWPIGRLIGRALVGMINQAEQAEDLERAVYLLDRAIQVSERVDSRGHHARQVILDYTRKRLAEAAQQFADKLNAAAREIALPVEDIESGSVVRHTEAVRRALTLVNRVLDDIPRAPQIIDSYSPVLPDPALTIGDLASYRSDQAERLNPRLTDWQELSPLLVLNYGQRLSHRSAQLQRLGEVTRDRLRDLAAARDRIRQELGMTLYERAREEAARWEESGGPSQGENAGPRPILKTTLWPYVESRAVEDLAATAHIENVFYFQNIYRLCAQLTEDCRLRPSGSIEEQLSEHGVDNRNFDLCMQGMPVWPSPDVVPGMEQLQTGIHEASGLHVLQLIIHEQSHLSGSRAAKHPSGNQVGIMKTEGCTELLAYLCIGTCLPFTDPRSAPALVKHALVNSGYYPMMRVVSALALLSAEGDRERAFHWIYDYHRLGGSAISDLENDALECYPGGAVALRKLHQRSRFGVTDIYLRGFRSGIEQHLAQVCGYEDAIFQFDPVAYLFFGKADLSAAEEPTPSV